MHIPLKHSLKELVHENLVIRKNYVVCCVSLSTRKFQVDVSVIAIFVHGIADTVISVGQKWLNGFLTFTLIEF